METELRLNTAQVMQHQWAKDLRVDDVPSKTLARATEEFVELSELLLECKTPAEFDELCKTDANFRRRVEEELGDVLVVTLNMCTAMGLDAENLFLKRLARNHIKYPPAEIQDWMENQNLNLIEALKKAKDRWNGNH